MRTIGNTATPDVVSDLLETVRVRTSIYCRSDMRAPWGFGVRAHGNPSFHIVTNGNCWLEVDPDGTPIELHAGDLVLLPHGPTHRLRDRPGSATEWLDDILADTPPDEDGRLHYGGDGAVTELVCGAFELEGDNGNPILRELPPVITIGRGGDAPAPWVAATLELAGDATGSSAPGAQAVLGRLADLMLTQALRIQLVENGAAEPSQARALRDPHIATAIHLIHTQPDERWTVERLAKQVGYSRSAFAARFRQLVGESPMAYVTRTRLAGAARQLQRSSMSISEIAHRAGYASEASFARAFKRAFGVAPGAYRT